MQSYWLYVIGAMLAWGCWGFFPKLAVSRMDFKDATVWEWLGMWLVALPCLLLIRGKPSMAGNGWIFAVMTGIAGLLGALSYNRAMSLCGTRTAGVIVVSAMYPIVSVALSMLFLKHEINARQLFGILLSLTGCAIIVKAG